MTMLSSLLAGIAVASTGVGSETPETQNPAPSATHPATVPVGPDPVYPSEFYVPFQPQTALDMLERTPGFILSEGSSVRGFGGAAGNVLIDGQRPTVKAGGVTEVLKRIAVARVERIVLLRGADAAEAQGQTLVANLILKSDAGGTGNASMTLRHTDEGRIAPSGSVSYARRIGGWQTSVELAAETIRYPSSAIYLDRAADDILSRTRIERIFANAPEYRFAFSTAGKIAGGTLTMNLRLNADSYASDRAVNVFAGAVTAAPDFARTIFYRETGRSGELGIDWTRGLGAGWTAKIVSLGRIERNETDEDYAEPGYRGVSMLRQKPSELVGRATLAREGNHPVRPEVGFEIASNRLASRLDYAENVGAGLIPVALENADTRVSELRGEAFANVTVRLASPLNLEAGVAVEVSRIQAIGDVTTEQSLSYLKPLIALVWSLTPHTQLRLGERRTVDQLDFGDFAASVNQADGRSLGGNPGLRPARLTRALLRLDHRWGKGGALAIEAWHQWHDGLLGYVLLPSGDNALGSIGNGRQWGATASGALPLNALLRGARLTFEGSLRGSRLRDLVTGAYRPMDSIAPRSLTAEVRHDLPTLRSSWGVNATASERTEVYYNGELLSARSRATFGAYLETTRFAGMKATLKATGLGGEHSYRLRRFYAPSRMGAYTGSETRDQRQGAVLSLTLARAM